MMHNKKQDRQEMPSQDEQKVIATLIALARLSCQSASLSGTEHSSIASQLLASLLDLCDAYAGALLFPRDADNREPVLLDHRTSLSNLWYPAALHKMQTEQVNSLLPSFLPTNPEAQWTSTDDGWIIYRFWRYQPGHTAAPDSTELVSQSRNSLPRETVLLVLRWQEQGYQRHVEHSKALLSLVAPGVSSVLSQLMLVTSMHALEAQLEHHSLQQMDLLKAEMVATVSHELRSPLASIKGYTATLLRHEHRLSSRERHEFLLAIRDSSDRLSAVIDRLLEISQLETGAITLQFAPVDLVHLVNEAFFMLKQRYTDKHKGRQDSGYTFNLRLEDENGNLVQPQELLVQADRSRLREVLDNLLENAVNYSPKGGNIDVVLRPTSHSRLVAAGYRDGSAKPDNNDQPMVEICVHDTGIGIPATHLPYIFDRFHRVDTRLVREVNGLGLGLAICREIIERHHGMIWVESEFGKGSTFRVCLPALCSEDE